MRVRMAIHTGECEERDGDYFGPAVNRVARLEAIAHGGQVLFSRATAEVVRDHFPSGVSLRDMGTHRLKDLSRPEKVFQLDVDGLPPSSHRCAHSTTPRSEQSARVRLQLRGS